MSDHYLQDLQCDRVTGAVYTRGVSIWSVADGPHTRREMQRATRLNSIPELKRWAKRHKLDATKQIEQWEKITYECHKVT